jgi:hypothetical protein
LFRQGGTGEYRWFKPGAADRGCGSTTAPAGAVMKMAQGFTSAGENNQSVNAVQ